MTKARTTSDENEWTSKGEIAFRSLMVGLFCLGLLCALHPDIRNTIRDYWQPEFRKVLSTVSGDLMNTGKYLKVLKIQTRDGIFLEIYGGPELNTRPLIERLKLPDNIDGFYNFRGEALNLALHDVDGDQFLEILAPTFDQDLVAHLNVIRYNPTTDRFEPVTP